MDVARAAMGQGWPFAAGLWNEDGVSEPSRSEGRMIGRTVLVTFAKTKVTRPGGRNQKHQQKRGNSEQAQEQPTPNCQSDVRTDHLPDLIEVHARVLTRSIFCGSGCTT
jgi:hypothetical protein